MAVEGAATARVFETHVEKVLAPSLLPGQIVVMDNLGAHEPKRVREPIEERGCELLLSGTRSKEALVVALGAALSAIRSQEVRGYFEHAGYRPAGQLP